MTAADTRAVGVWTAAPSRRDGDVLPLTSVVHLARASEGGPLCRDRHTTQAGYYGRRAVGEVDCPRCAERLAVILADLEAKKE